MFSKLFSESGLSLERLRALVEVGSAGSIVKAAAGDVVRQSQYSRQIKELEDFFTTRLVERYGKGTRLTSSGRELARISRFFMLGLSNFKRGCLAEEQTVRIAAGPTFCRHFLVPVLSRAPLSRSGASFISSVASDAEMEQRLHELTLDFGVVGTAALSRPLQTRVLGRWKLQLWAPRALVGSATKATRIRERGKLPQVLATELESFDVAPDQGGEARLVCESFLDSRSALEGREAAAWLPDFLIPDQHARAFVRVPVPEFDSRTFHFYLAWNPRLLRLNPHAARRRDWLAEALCRQMST